MKKQLIIASTLLATFALAGCQKETPEVAKQAEPAAKATQSQPASPHMAQGQMGQQAMANSLTGTVLETIDASGYVYVHLDTGKEKVWAAGPPTPIKKGDSLTISTNMPMQNFHSKALNRDFPVLYFVDHF